jgi:IS5 family transposase
LDFCAITTWQPYASKRCFSQSASNALSASDVVEANSLLHGQETDGYGDAGYQGVDKRPDMPVATPERKLSWHIAMKRSKRKALDPQQPISAMQERLEKAKSSI